MSHNSNFKIMETNIQITAVNKEFQNGTKGYQVLVQGLDNKIDCKMNFTDPLKAMRYMFMLSKKLDLQINKIELAALSIAYKRIKDAEQKLVQEVQEAAEQTSNEVNEHEDEVTKVKVSSNDTPMVKQFKELKDKHPEALLIFRCGDFYETYFEDAKAAAEILGITLTRTSKDGTEMAGFPYHALDAYLPKLIRAGKRVAICDQMEQPKTKRSSKAAAQQELKLEVAQ